MPTENKIQLIPTSQIRVPQDRQRKKIDENHIEQLMLSIEGPVGLLHPIIVEQKPGYLTLFNLVVGECRLKAWRKLEERPVGLREKFLPGIPARLISDLTDGERKDAELDENIKRRNLSWQDETLAIAEHYDRWQEIQDDEDRENDEEPSDFSFATGAGFLGVSTRHYKRYVTVGREVRENNQEILACDSARAANALLDRAATRIIERELSTFGEAEKKVIDPTKTFLDLDNLELEEPKENKLYNWNILTQAFEDWRELENLPKFNFVHCDFPYGKGLHESDLYDISEKPQGYEDTKEIYWGLLDALIDAKDGGLFSASCHFLFWFPMDEYHKTLRTFEVNGFYVNPYPLIWFKSDKVGLIPDPTRYGRRIYETAFLMSLGDRKIIKPVANASYHPSERKSGSEHPSHKSRKMLQEFLRMFIDEESIVLDPTCGSGSALSASLYLGAKYALGLDINESCVTSAQETLEETTNLILRGGTGE